MKITFTTIAFLFFLIAKGQVLVGTSYIEKTHVSPKVGVSLGYQFLDEIEVGGFYQKSSTPVHREFGRPLKSEVEFYGFYFDYPLWTTSKASLKLNTRTGVSNSKNFVITPSLKAAYKPFNMLSIGGGIGTRAFRPTFMLSIGLHLNNPTRS